ncbi:CsbD family protein [Planococcus sp. CAU13]|uniref:CsbD family protein n=1 Tax=Planococcus sp. CAU13 TaxID=1541197 RepID=UPI00053001EB|nr:CsbD family protein [Planococcus sp. CAU13]
MSKDGFSDKVKSAVSKGKGELKDQVGNATDNKQMQREGKTDKTKGNIQDAVGDFKNKINKDK